MAEYCKHSDKFDVHVTVHRKTTTTTTSTQCTQLAAQLYPTTASNTNAAHHMR
jgi:hypothetical protein